VRSKAACLSVVARPHQHVDGALHRAARPAAADAWGRGAEPHQLAPQGRDALRRMLPVQVDQRLAIVGGLRTGRSLFGVGWRSKHGSGSESGWA
jgi:hypothetical protein